MTLCSSCVDRPTKRTLTFGKASEIFFTPPKKRRFFDIFEIGRSSDNDLLGSNSKMGPHLFKSPEDHTGSDPRPRDLPHSLQRKSRSVLASSRLALSENLSSHLYTGIKKAISKTGFKDPVCGRANDDHRMPDLFAATPPRDGHVNGGH